MTQQLAHSAAPGSAGLPQNMHLPTVNGKPSKRISNLSIVPPSAAVGGEERNGDEQENRQKADNQEDNYQGIAFHRVSIGQPPPFAQGRT